MAKKKYNHTAFSFRLNLNNPEHVRINEVLKGLNPDLFKSKNQFLVDAAIFYIDNYGKENLMELDKKSGKEFIRMDDMEAIKQELIRTVAIEARREVLQSLGALMSGMGNSPRLSKNSDETNEEVTTAPEDDEVIAGLALNWMMGSGGDNE